MTKSVLGWLRFLMVAGALLVGAGETRQVSAQSPTALCYQAGCPHGWRPCAYTGTVWCYIEG